MKLPQLVDKFVHWLTFGEQQQCDVPYEWIVVRNGQDIAYLHDPEWADMFWRRPILTPLTAGKTSPLFEDDFWEDCNFTLNHATLDLHEEHVIIRATGSPPRVLVRGVPEVIPNSQFPKRKQTESKTEKTPKQTK